MSDEFYNPFHFVPVAKPALDLMPRNTLERTPSERNSHAHVTHDRYVVTPETYSGRIVCKLRLESPTVLGARRDTSEQPAAVEPYEILAERADGQFTLEPAIPETSLRGMIGSVFESVSSSALRVLNNTPLSARVKAMKDDDGPSEALQAVGMVHVDERGHRRLLPLSFPVLELSGSVGDQRRLTDNRKTFDIPDEWHAYEHFAAVKIYLRHNADISTTADNQQVYFIEDGGFFRPSKHRIANVADARVKGGLIARIKQARLLTAEETRLPHNQGKSFVAGVVRNLGEESCEALMAVRHGDENKNRRQIAEAQLPGNVKYGWFIPLHPSVYDVKREAWVYLENQLPLIDAEQAIRELESLAEQRTLADLRLPFELRGSLRNANLKRSGNERSHCIKLRQGDLVCFNLLKNSAMIDRLAVSSIWRKPTGNVWDWFKLIDPNLLPMNAARDQVTLAEQLFGFVQSGKSAHKVKALAGRLRFSSGRLCMANRADNAYEPQGTTPILGSPKPPSPQLYFHHANSDQAVRKSQMPGEAGGTIRPLGRKWYLHHHTVAWQSLDPHDARTKRQKTRVQPLRAGLEFVFDVEFTNLSRHELALLAYALRPRPEFRHRLGLGKPLGLGTVQVQPLGLFLIDRRRRYETNDLFDSPRYHRVAVCDGASAIDLELKLAAADVQRRYQRELKSWPDPAEAPDPVWRDLCEQATRLLDHPAHGLTDTRAALESLGNPATTADAPVHYPRLPDPLLPRVKIDGRERPNTESELFRWHVWNQERPQPQKLSPRSQGVSRPNKLQRGSPFMFFLHAGLDNQQRAEIERLLRPAYSDRVVPDASAALGDVNGLRARIEAAQKDGLICVHLGIERKELPAWAKVTSNHAPVAVTSFDRRTRQNQPTNFGSALRKYLPHLHR